MQKSRVITAAGAALVIAGALGPFYRVALLGSQALWQASPLGAWLTLAAAVVALYGAWSGKRGAMIVGALAVAVLTALAFHHYFGVLDGIEGKTHKLLLGRIGRMVTGRIHLATGAWLMASGAAVMLVGALSAAVAKKGR